MECKNAGISKELYEKILSTNERMNFQRYIGINIKEIGENYVLMTINLNKNHSNTAGIAHGGVTATVLDAAMGMAAATTGKNVVTLEMKINYIAPGEIGSEITAKGTVIHGGKRTIVSEGKVYNSEEQIIAISTGTYFIID